MSATYDRGRSSFFPILMFVAECMRLFRPNSVRSDCTRTYAQLALSKTQKHARRATKEEGTVAEFFSNLTTEGPPLEPRFAALKKEMCVDRDALVHSWRAVLREPEPERNETMAYALYSAASQIRPYSRSNKSMLTPV